MATISGLNTFIAGTPAQASQVNTNFGLVKSFAEGVSTGAGIDAGAISNAKLAAGAVTSDKILDGTIVDGDINATAAIALSKLATGALPTAITVVSANIVNGTIVADDLADSSVTSAKILDGTIVNADINATADIALSKLAVGALPTGITVASANIVNGTIATDDIADGAVTAAKKSGFYGLTYQDFTITGVMNDADVMFTSGSDHVITFSGGKTFNDVVSIVPNSGINSTVTLYHVELGAQSGILNSNQARVNCSISNTIDSGGSVNVRVWFLV